MAFAFMFPQIDPVAISLGPLAIRWYALAYIAGLVLGWQYVKWLVRREPHAMTGEQVDDFLVWATIGVVLGGRLGYVLFYNPDYYLANPLAIPQVWQGGMSFHGGLLGVVCAVVLFCRRHHLDILRVGDAIAAAAPIGLFFGRIANFINGELWGRASDVPWAVVFPHAGPEPRHPSQIYEAILEGLVLFVILHLLWRAPRLRAMPGLLFGTFLAGYGIARFIVEYFRQPDAHLGYIGGVITMGQILSLPLIAAGAWLIWRARRVGPAREAS